jgi:hypothetical protein
MNSEQAQIMEHYKSAKSSYLFGQTPIVTKIPAQSSNGAANEEIERREDL